MLRGKKVQLRSFKKSDIQHILKRLNDAEVTQYLMTYLPFTEMAGEKFIDEFVGDTKRAFFVVETTEGGMSDPIGMTDLGNVDPKDHKASFGICIGETDYRSKGYSTEAARLLIKYGFEQLNLHRIDSDVLAFNERSLGMHRSVGFKEEGRQRDAAFKNGKFHDVLIFGLLRQEWLGFQETE